MPTSMCFSHPSDVPPGATPRVGAQAAPRGLRKMPYTCYSFPLMCFSYPDEVSQLIPDRDTAPTAPPGLRRMPSSICFRY